MGIVVVAAHHIIASIEQLNDLFHGIDTQRHIFDTGCNHIRFTQVQEINFCVWHGTSLLQIFYGNTL